MDMTITDEAVTWFKNEMELNEGDHVQFFVRYGGCGNFQTGFSLGVTAKSPEEPEISVEKNGILFYVEKKDIWYFDNTDFHITYDRDQEEISYDHHNE